MADYYYYRDNIFWLRITKKWSILSINTGFLYDFQTQNYQQITVHFESLQHIFAPDSHQDWLCGSESESVSPTSHTRWGEWSMVMLHLQTISQSAGPASHGRHKNTTLILHYAANPEFSDQVVKVRTSPGQFTWYSSSPDYTFHRELTFYRDEKR